MTKPVSNQQVYIEIDGKLVDQQLTNDSGQISFTYLPQSSGNHKFRFYTKFENGYAPVEKTLDTYTIATPDLTLTPKEVKTEHYAEITGNVQVSSEGAPVTQGELQLYVDNVVYDKATSINADGTGTVSYAETNTDMGYTTAYISIGSYKPIEGQTSDIKITVYNKTDNGNKYLLDVPVYLYMDYNSTPLQTGTTNSKGKVTFSDILLSDTEQHVFIVAIAQQDGVTSTDGNTYNIGPMWEKKVVKATPCPTITLAMTKTKETYRNKVIGTIKMTEKNHIFSNTALKLQYREVDETTDNSTWYTAFSLTTDKAGTAQFTYDNNHLGNIELRVYYAGNSDYASTYSNTIEMTCVREGIKVKSTVTPSSPAVNDSIKMVTTVTDKNGNPIKGMYVSYSFIDGDSETSINKGVTDSTGTLTIKALTTFTKKGKYTLRTSVQENVIEVAKPTFGTLAALTGAADVSTHAYESKEVDIALNVKNREFYLIVLMGSNTTDKGSVTFTSNSTVNMTFYVYDKTKYNSGSTVAIKQKTINIYQDGTKIASPQTDSNGKATYSLSLEDTGTYLFKFVLPSSSGYNSYTTTRSIIIIEGTAATLKVSNVNAVIGQSTTIKGTCPKDANDGSFQFKLIPADGSNEIIIGGNNGRSLKNNNGTVSITTNWSGHPKGKHKYYLRYSGGTDYILSKSSQMALNLLSSSFTFNLVDSNGDKLIDDGVITDTVGVLIPFSGTITDGYNIPYTGTLTIKYAGKTVQVAVTSGKIIDTAQIDVTNISSGSYDIKFTTEARNGVTGELSAKLHVLGDKDLPQTAVNVAKLATDTSRAFKITVPLVVDGILTLYQTDEDGNIQSTLKTINTETNTDTTNITTTTTDTTATYTVKDTSVLEGASVGTYYTKWKLTDDSTYADTTTDVIPWYVLTPADITVTNTVRYKEQVKQTMQITVVDPLNQPANGVLTVSGSGITTTNITIKDGEGKYEIPASARKYSNTNHITSVVLKYPIDENDNPTFYDSTGTTVPSTLRTKLSTSITKKTYNLPKRLNGIFINKNSAIITEIDNSGSTDVDVATRLTNYYNAGFDCLFVRANTEDSIRFTTLSKLIAAMESTSITTDDGTDTAINLFHIHVVTNCLFDATQSTSKAGWGTYYDNSTNGTHKLKDKDGRIDSLNRFIQQLFDTYRKYIDGMMFDYIRCANASYGETNASDIKDVLDEITDKVIRITPDKTVTVSACMIGEYDQALTYGGQSYKDFSDICDFICPMVYSYEYMAIETDSASKVIVNYWWMQKQMSLINTAIGDNFNMVAIIQGYQGTGNETIYLSQAQYRYSMIDLWLYGTRGCIIFREGAMTTSTSKLPVGFNKYIDESTNKYYRNKFKVGASYTLVDKETYPNANSSLIVGVTEYTTVSKATAKTTGIALAIRDLYYGYIGSNVTVKLEFQDSNGTVKASGSAIIQKDLTYVKMDLDTLATGTKLVMVWTIVENSAKKVGITDSSNSTGSFNVTLKD